MPQRIIASSPSTRYLAKTAYQAPSRQPVPPVKGPMMLAYLMLEA